MTQPRTVLFIQHAGGLGGSCVSLAYTVQGLDPRRYKALVALIRPSDTVRNYHRSFGIETVDAPGIRTFEHTTASWATPQAPRSLAVLADTLASWKESERRTLELVERVKPDLVHLNSVVLLPSARALHRAGIPFVWHVRECPPPSTLGMRLAIQRDALRNWPAALYFLSKTEQRLWTGDNETGLVVHDFVDTERFHPQAKEPARARFGIAADAPVVAFLGGLSEIKGFFPLVEAATRLHRDMPGFRLLLAGAVAESSRSLVARAARALLPIVGSATHSQKTAAALKKSGLRDAAIRLPFSSDIENVIAAADIVAFPATRDHFARPIIEAGAMERPVVASRLPILTELVEAGTTGLLVEPGSADELTVALRTLLEHPAMAAEMGREGRRRALERFDLRTNTNAIMDSYDKVLGEAR